MVCALIYLIFCLCVYVSAFFQYLGLTSVRLCCLGYILAFIFVYATTHHVLCMPVPVLCVHITALSSVPTRVSVFRRRLCVLCVTQCRACVLLAMSVLLVPGVCMYVCMHVFMPCTCAHVYVYVIMSLCANVYIYILFCFAYLSIKTTCSTAVALLTATPPSALLPQLF